MAKNQKKPEMLSMGGVLPRKSLEHKHAQPAATAQSKEKPSCFKRPNLRAQTKTRTQILSNLSKRSGRGRKFKGFALLLFIKEKLLYAAILAFITGLYLFDINRFPAFAGIDRTSNPDSLSDIDSVLFFPVKVFLVLLHKLHINLAYDARLVGAAAMLLSLFCFYKLVSSWVSRRMSVLTVLLYACSSWPLFLARQDATAAFTLAFLPISLYLGKLLLKTDSLLYGSLIFILIAQFVFIPGGIWFLVLLGVSGLVYFKKPISTLALPGFVGLITLVGYGFLIYKLSLGSISSLVGLTGFEAGSIPPLSAIWGNISALPGQLFYGGLHDSAIWLPGTPIIDWVSAVFILTGLIYIYKSLQHPVRKVILSAFFILSLALIFINGAFYISLLLPLLYIVFSVGLTHLTDRWLSIFPNNPLARGFGLVVVFSLVFLVCSYHIERYFIGWPKTEAYHQIYDS